MAETAISSEMQRTAGVQKSKKLSTRVDLTPMVDLGFLLITFFVFTTNLSAPKALGFVVPSDGDSTQTDDDKTLNLILSADNKVHYYIGNEVGKLSCTDFSPEGARAVIASMQKRVKQHFGEKEQLVILIRPTESSSYMNLVDILDEILIMDVKKYALMDSPGKEIQTFLQRHRPC